MFSYNEKIQYRKNRFCNIFMYTILLGNLTSITEGVTIVGILIAGAMAYT